MVVRVEAFVRELLGDQNSHVAVVREAGVVAAVLHSVVVRVEDVQVQSVLRGVLREQHHQLVRTVLVHVVVHVHAVARATAVADHVHLDHADHRLVLDARDVVRVGVAAIEPLLFAGEMAEADGAVRLRLQERLGDFHHADRASAVIISSRSCIFRLPRPARGRIQVSAQIQNLLRFHRAGELDDEVVHLAAAHLVLVTGRLEPDAGIELLEILHRQFDVAMVAVAGLQRHGFAVDADRDFAREFAKSLLDVGLLDGSQESGDLRVHGGGRRFDARPLLIGGATNLLGIELAGEAIARFIRAVRVSLALVAGVELGRAVEMLPHEIGSSSGDGEKRERDGDHAQVVQQVSHTITLTFLKCSVSAERVEWRQKQLATA